MGVFIAIFIVFCITILLIVNMVYNSKNEQAFWGDKHNNDEIKNIIKRIDKIEKTLKENSIK